MSSKVDWHVPGKTKQTHLIYMSNLDKSDINLAEGKFKETIGSFLSNNSRFFLSMYIICLRRSLNGKIGHHMTSPSCSSLDPTFLFHSPPESPRLRCIGKRSGPPMEAISVASERWPGGPGVLVRVSGVLAKGTTEA